ncbi:hypothetical protein F4811DRAFT_136336 [Daldinia bambusicola]|nr:hypothetical protein F4811DRAFT_136336 [Daldinia bambusicola]
MKYKIPCSKLQTKVQTTRPGWKSKFNVQQDSILVEGGIVESKPRRLDSLKQHPLLIHDQLESLKSWRFPRCFLVLPLLLLQRPPPEVGGANPDPDPLVLLSRLFFPRCPFFLLHPATCTLLLPTILSIPAYIILSPKGVSQSMGYRIIQPQLLSIDYERRNNHQ